MPLIDTHSLRRDDIQRFGLGNRFYAGRCRDRRIFVGAERPYSGPDTLDLPTPVPTYGENLTTAAWFTVWAAQGIPFVVSYHFSYEVAVPGGAALLRSLITLEPLTYAPSDGIIAAPSTSLPERPCGMRNSDYRFRWVRDGTFTLNALLLARYQEESAFWRDWTILSVAGKPEDSHRLYSIRGTGRLDETGLK